MIVLQILAFLALIPFTVLLLISFNIYLMQWIYLSLLTLIGMIYAALCGLVINNIHAGIMVFIVVVVLYFIRMKYILSKAKHSNVDYPILRGKIKNKNGIFNASLLCPILHLLN